jgi:hypothetical protein
MFGNYRVAAQLAASQEGLSSIELVRFNFFVIERYCMELLQICLLGNTELSNKMVSHMMD